MSKKKRYSMIFYLSENTWSMSGIPCPDCVDESNYQAWSRYLSKQIDKLLCAKTMQTAEFQEELETVRRDKEEQLAHQKKLDEAAEVRRRRSCMERPKIDYVPKGLYIDLEEAYSKYFQQVVTFFPDDKDDFNYWSDGRRNRYQQCWKKGDQTLLMPLPWDCANICLC